MIAFLDSSAFVRRYLSEPGSETVRQLFRGRRSIAASRLAFVEISSAVARATRARKISEPQREQILDRLPGDFLELDTVVETSRDVHASAAALVVLHPLRAYDAMQLASCLELRRRGSAIELWSADGDLTRAARREGLKVVTLS